MHGYEIVCDAKVMLIVNNDCETSIYPSGKLIVKTASKEFAEDVADRIYKLIV
jgi:hypothetical protein